MRRAAQESYFIDRGMHEDYALIDATTWLARTKTTHHEDYALIYATSWLARTEKMDGELFRLLVVYPLFLCCLPDVYLISGLICSCAWVPDACFSEFWCAVCWVCFWTFGLLV